MVLSPPARAGDRPAAPASVYLPPAASAVAALGWRTCRWPLGEPGDDDFAFCGGTTPPRGSYCAIHARVARSGVRGGGRR